MQILLCAQIFLLDEDGAVLNSKFLKSAENVKKGSKIELSNYLVEVCDPRTLLEGTVFSIYPHMSSCFNYDYFLITPIQ